MRYFLDTEFIEGTQKKWFGKKTKPTIDLISIGIVTEDDREYYAISKDFNLKEAWNRFQYADKTPFEKQNGFEANKIYWLRDNVLKPIFDEFYIEVFGIDMPTFNYTSFKYLINKIGKTNKQIAKEVIEFAQGDPIERTNPTFYTYYGAYDWVVFCWLFGRMIDLPRGFPMFSKDLKVMKDSIQKRITKKSPTFNMKLHKDYPTQDNCHNALDDARWNKNLYNFLNNL